MIEIKDMCKTFRRNKEKTLDNINLQIHSGAIVGIIGENGAGKTTLMKAMTGLLVTDQGSVIYDGILLNKKTRKNIYKKTSIVLDGGRSLQWRVSVTDNFKYFSYLKDVPDAKINKNIELYSKYFKIEDLLNKRVNELSLGQKQIVAIICTLISDCRYLYLDEPTNGLDLEVKSLLIGELKKIKKDFGTTIIITSHDLEFLLSTADSCIVMDKGKFIKEVNLEEENFQSSYFYYKEAFFS